MTYAEHCAECGESLTSYDIKHGWVTINVGWSEMGARVHTICRRKFSERDLADQRARSRRQWGIDSQTSENPVAP